MSVACGETKEEPITEKADEQVDDPYKLEPTITGQAVSLAGIAAGTDGKVTSDNAAELIGQGDMFLLNSNGTLYFVYDNEGNFAGATLAKYAGKTIGLIGKEKIFEGINIFYAEEITVVE